MKRKKQPKYVWARLEGEAKESLQTIIRVVFGELLNRDIETWLRDEGRGLVLFQFTDGTVGSIQPPTYLPSSSWAAAPALISESVKVEIDNALVSYKPDKEYIIFIVSIDGDYEGTYTWWREPLPSRPGAFDLWKAK